MSRAMTSPSTPPPSSDPNFAPFGFTDTWRRVTTEPRAFFAEMPQVGGLRDPLVFLAICAVLNGLGVLVWHMSLSAAVGAVLRSVLQGVVLAAITTLVAQQLFDGPAGFEPTFRAVAYAAAPLALAWVPGLGVLAQVYAWFLAIRGLESVQRLDTAKAVMSVAIAVGLLCYAGVGYGAYGPPRCGSHQTRTL
jgi:hypothetical protein